MSSIEEERFPIETGRIPVNGLLATEIFLRYLHSVNAVTKLNSTNEDSFVKLLSNSTKHSRNCRFPKTI